MSGGRIGPLAYALRSEDRVEILRYLGRQRPRKEICARELSEILDRKLEVTSYHLQRLHECGAVSLVPKPSAGPAAHFYVFDVEDPWALRLLGLEGPTTNSDEPDGAGSP